ncbi:glycosyl transferase family 1 [Flavobacteriales bacterium 34_180_T64]|nr:glycosyl transferase family 1 [Flavobacteriales bacterium 34_180_T64]
MKRILYVGNNLKSKNSNVSSIQVLGSLLKQEGYTLHFASSKVNKVLRLLDMMFTFFKYQRHVDYVIIDTYSTHNFYYALIISQLCRLFKVNYITSLNGGNLPARLKRDPFLCGLIFNNSYVNVTPSLYLKDAFENYGYPNLVYIPNTIVIDNYTIAPKSFDTIKLLWVRSFAKIYNPTMAIIVLKTLIDKGYTAELCMVGPDSDGTLQDVIEFANELKVPVTITGKLPKSEWIALAKNYNIFINTTNFDNMPVSVIEAMALGLAIVSTNVGGIPYLLANEVDGLLVQKNDMAEMVNAILNIVTHQADTKRRILNARHKVEFFDWETIKQKWNAVLT